MCNSYNQQFTEKIQMTNVGKNTNFISGHEKQIKHET